MISHVHVGVTDFDRAFVFYSSVMDALGLYLNFVNLFQLLLSFMGQRNSD